MLETMCNDISTALGGVNKLEVVIDEEINTIQIIDQSVIPNKEKLFPNWYEPAIVSGSDERKVDDEEDYTLELMGYNLNSQNNVISNFVRNVNLETGITPEYANMIAIGATAGGYRPGEESTAFSKWNIGLSDRFHNVTYDAQLDTEPEVDKPFEEIYAETVDEYDQYLYSEHKILGIATTEIPDDSEHMQLEDDVIQANLGNITDYWKYLHASSSQDSNKPSNQTGFMPFNMTIDLDGLSGLKIYNKINADIRFLPSNYPQSLDFIITKVNSTLSDNDWVTSIETMCIAKSAPATFKSSPVIPGGSSGVAGVTTRSGRGGPKPRELARTNVRMKLMRILDDGLQTLGVLQVYAEDGVTKLYDLKTVELPNKGNKNNISCIPTGTYLVRAANDGGSKYGYYFFLRGINTNSPNPYNKITGGGYERKGVLIHRGSSSNDLAGCISPGSAFSKNLKAKYKAKGKYQEYDPDAEVGNLQGNPQGILSWNDSIASMEKLANTLYVDGGKDVAYDTSFYLEIYNNPSGLLTGGNHSNTTLNAISIT